MSMKAGEEISMFGGSEPLGECWDGFLPSFMSCVRRRRSAVFILAPPSLVLRTADPSLT